MFSAGLSGCGGDVVVVARVSASMVRVAGVDMVVVQVGKNTCEAVAGRRTPDETSDGLIESTFSKSRVICSSNSFKLLSSAAADGSPFIGSGGETTRVCVGPGVVDEQA